MQRIGVWIAPVTAQVMMTLLLVFFASLATAHSLLTGDILAGLVAMARGLQVAYA